jgi:hypothetical protein
VTGGAWPSRIRPGQRPESWRVGGTRIGQGLGLALALSHYRQAAGLQDRPQACAKRAVGFEWGMLQGNGDRQGGDGCGIVLDPKLPVGGGRNFARPAEAVLSPYAR